MSGRTLRWCLQPAKNPCGIIPGHISFYPALLCCLVDGLVATPQPGGFYGGWVTPEVVGPFKGDPGSSGW